MDDATPRAKEAAPERPVRRSGAGRFVVVFTLITLSVLTAYWYIADSAANAWYLDSVARQNAWLLCWFGQDAAAKETANGPLVSFTLRPATEAREARQFAYVIVPECGAVEVMTIFLAGVLAFPAPWGKRLAGLALGLPALYAVNLVRLTCLGVIGALDSSGRWFELSHHYGWQAIYVVFVVAAWLVWVEYMVKRRSDGNE